VMAPELARERVGHQAGGQGEQGNGGDRAGFLQVLSGRSRTSRAVNVTGHRW
jgi:hypothetical protein